MKWVEVIVVVVVIVGGRGALKGKKKNLRGGSGMGRGFINSVIVFFFFFLWGFYIKKFAVSIFSTETRQGTLSLA